MTWKYYSQETAEGAGPVDVYVSAKSPVVEKPNPEPLAPRRDLINHSPSGFSWGYEGSGPAQLALAITADALGEEKALKCYQDFKREIIAETKPDVHLIMTSSFVRAWYAAVNGVEA